MSADSIRISVAHLGFSWSPSKASSTSHVRAKGELGGKCGSTAFTLEDDTGSIEVAIRRANRLIEPLREGDRVQVTAQIEVVRNRENLPVRICVEASEIQHLGR